MTPAKVVEPEVGASVRIEVVLPTLSFTTPLPDSEIDGELPSRSRTTAVLLIVTGVELPSELLLPVWSVPRLIVVAPA